MSPQYAIDWWQKRRLNPPQLSPVRFFEKKLAWRYAKGVPSPSKSTIVLGDSTSLLPEFHGKLGQNGLSKPSLMLTSPPYLGITDYHYDQISGYVSGCSVAHPLIDELLPISRANIKASLQMATYTPLF